MRGFEREERGQENVKFKVGTIRRTRARPGVALELLSKEPCYRRATRVIPVYLREDYLDQTAEVSLGHCERPKKRLNQPLCELLAPSGGGGRSQFVR